jgi:hypothetical protein
LAGESRTTKESNWSGQEASRRPREFLRRRLDDDLDPVDWVPPSERRQVEERQHEPIPPAELCPTCTSERRKSELTWVTSDLPGGGMQQIPWCERHGAIDLREPEPPDPNVCSSCGADVIWEMGDPRAGFQPVCVRCGPIQVREPEVDRREERPFRHDVSSNLPPPSMGRARGLTERDVVAVRRIPKPQPGPNLVFVDRHQGPTRPG